jgi:hypothetical protein
MPVPYQPQVRRIAYSVSCLPEDHIDARHFTIRVEYVSNGLWQVTDGWSFLGADGTWSEDFSSHELHVALDLAKEAAPKMTAGNHTVADVMAM